MVNKLNNTVPLIDVSIPADHHIIPKENEKIENNQDLRIKFEML